MLLLPSDNAWYCIGALFVPGVLEGGVSVFGVVLLPLVIKNLCFGSLPKNWGDLLGWVKILQI